MRVSKPVEFSKETLDVGEAFESVMTKFAEERKKGTASGAAMMTAMSSSVTQMFAAFEGVQNIDDEYKEDPAATINAMFVPINRGMFALIKK